MKQSDVGGYGASQLSPDPVASQVYGAVGSGSRATLPQGRTSGGLGRKAGGMPMR